MLHQKESPQLDNRGADRQLNTNSIGCNLPQTKRFLAAFGRQQPTLSFLDHET